MPKKIVKDVGMMQREILQYELNETGAQEAWVKAWDDLVPTARPDDMPGDALDRENAARCRDILATVELADMMNDQCAVDLRPLINKKLGEDSAQYLAAHWLGAYNRMMAQRQRLLEGSASAEAIGMMVIHAQEMGRLQERMWWRRGVVKVDPENTKTWKRREELALGKLEQEKSLRKAAEGRRIQAQDEKPDWHDAATLDAFEIKQKHPTYSRWRIAGYLCEKYEVSRDRCAKVLRANGVD